MKKPTKKLALASETIRELRRVDLAHGGVRPLPTVRTCETECEFPTLYPGCLL